MDSEEIKIQCSSVEFQSEIKCTESLPSLTQTKRMITISSSQFKDLTEESINRWSEKYLSCFEDILQPDPSYLDLLEISIKKIKDLVSTSRIEKYKYTMLNTSIVRNIGIKKSITKYLYSTKQKGRTQRKYKLEIARSYVNHTLEPSPNKEQQKQNYKFKPIIQNQSTHVQKSVQVLKKDRERVLIQANRLEVSNLSKIIKIPLESSRYQNQAQAEPSLLKRDNDTSIPFDDIFQGKESKDQQQKDESMKDISPKNAGYLKEITQIKDHQNQIKCWQIKHIRNRTSNNQSQQSHENQSSKISRDFISHMNSMQPKFPQRKNMTLRNNINKDQNSKRLNFEGPKTQQAQNFLTECLNNYYLNRLIRISLS